MRKDRELEWPPGLRPDQPGSWNRPAKPDREGQKANAPGVYVPDLTQDRNRA